MALRFTKHAQEKFAVLKRHGFRVTKKRVVETVKKPDLIDRSRLPLYIAQKSIDGHHVLRVVYRLEGKTKVIITFYPGRQRSYGKAQ